MLDSFFRENTEEKYVAEANLIPEPSAPDIVTEKPETLSEPLDKCTEQLISKSGQPFFHF